MAWKSEEITRLIRASIEEYENRLDRTQTGTILLLGDGIARVSGLRDCLAGEVLAFENGETGLALNLEDEIVSVVLLSEKSDLREGDEVRRTGQVLSVPVGESLLGRVVDALGNPIDGKGGIRAAERRPVEAAAPGILQRKSVYRPLQTGIKAIDGMIPIGCGQRELIIGDRQTGKSALAVDTILNQRGRGVFCIYVAIGQKRSTVAQLQKELEENGAMEYTTIVSATASQSAAEQYIAPYAGCAMAEYFMYSGRDVLIVYDDLSAHAIAYRTISLLLRRPPGREAYPGDVFYLHARLLERAAQMNEQHGGGSMTALPIVQTLAGDVSAYIPTNVISITDGQIFLETELFHAGVLPAINPGVSVSRVGGAAQTAAMKAVSRSLKLRYSQYRELEQFSQFGSELDADTRRRLDEGARVAAILKQPRRQPLRLSEQVSVFLAAEEGFLQSVELEQIPAYEQQLLSWLHENAGELLDAIEHSGALSEEDRAALREQIAAFSGVFQTKSE